VRNQAESRLGAEDVPDNALQINFSRTDTPMVRAGTLPAAPIIGISCPSPGQDPSLAFKASPPIHIMDTSGCSVDESARSETELWNTGGMHDVGNDVDLSTRPPERPPESRLESSLAGFLALRGRGCPTVAAAQPPSPLSNAVTFECVNLSENKGESFQEVKHEWDLVLPLVSNDIVLPESWCESSEDHCYLGSLDFIQRIGLVEHLRTRCGVHLVEVETLYGPQIIIDSHSCTIFHPMASLTGTTTDICKSIIDLAKSFSRVLLVLEAFPSSKANYSAETYQSHLLNVISTTVLQAFQKLVNKIKMAVSMLDEAEGGDVKVDIVVAKSVLEVARYVRVYGEVCRACEARCFRVILWGSRPWLQTEVRPRPFPSTRRGVGSLIHTRMKMDRISVHGPV
jgi:hypothetical protein